MYEQKLKKYAEFWEKIGGRNQNLPAPLLCTFFFSCLPLFCFLILSFPSVFSSLATFQLHLSLSYSVSRRSTCSLHPLPQCGSRLRRSSLVECLPSGSPLTSGESNWLHWKSLVSHHCLELCWFKAVVAKKKETLMINLHPFPFLRLSGMNLPQDFLYTLKCLSALWKPEMKLLQLRICG